MSIDDSAKLDLQFKFTEKFMRDKSACRRISGIKSDIARVHILKGRVGFKENRQRKALDAYVKAMNVCTGNKDAKIIKSEILFYRAECYQMIYWKEQNSSNRKRAVRFWKKVLQNRLLKTLH
jgi:hypothetical protein